MGKAKETILQKNIRKYEELKKQDFKSLKLHTDEKVMHCIDESDSRFYMTGCLVTNKGRIWSINHNKWRTPHIQKGYWRVGNVYVHLLVNHYFLSDDDRRIIKMVEEHNEKCVESEKWHIHVHHKKRVQKMDISNMSNEEKMFACMALNSKENLICQIKESDHVDAHRLMNGKPTMGVEKGTEHFDSFTSVVVNGGVTEAYYTYSENGIQQIHVKRKFPTLTPEEEAELDKIVPHPFLY